MVRWLYLIYICIIHVNSFRISNIRNRNNKIRVASKDITNEKSYNVPKVTEKAKYISKSSVKPLKTFEENKLSPENDVIARKSSKTSSIMSTNDKISTPTTFSRSNSKSFDREFIDTSLSSTRSTNSEADSFENDDDPALRRGLYKNVYAAVEEKDISKISIALKNLAFSNRNNFDHSEAIYPIFRDILHSDLVKQATATEVSEWLWSFSKLGFKLRNRAHNTLVMDLTHMFCSFPNLTARQVTTGMGGLSKLRMKWSYLTMNMRTDITNALEAVVRKLNDREVGNLLHSLSKLEVPWIELTKSIQNGFLETFVLNSKLLVSQQGSMTIYALGNMGLLIDNLLPAVRDNIYAVSILVLNESEGNTSREVNQQVSNVIYGLMKMGCKYHDLPQNVVEHIFLGIQNMFIHMNEQEIANTCYSLGMMGFSWEKHIPIKTQTVILSSITQRIASMITQGFSSLLYGLALMGMPWSVIDEPLLLEMSRAALRSFGSTIPMKGDSSQGISNVIYSLGEIGAKWTELPPLFTNNLCKGIELWKDSFGSQEISITIYGLGCLRASFHDLPSTTQVALIKAITRVHLQMNQQEVCSTMHGFAKMGAEWDLLPDHLRNTLMLSIQKQSDLGSLCLACTIYALGLLGAKWAQFPVELQDKLVAFSSMQKLQDQTFSNVIYGLSLLGVEWATFSEEFKNNLLEMLADEATFQGNLPQHIANTIWGLAKMDATWDLLPHEQISAAFVKCSKNFIPQEASNSVYGFATIDASWDSLESSCQQAIETALVATVQSMTIQETANLMYSLAVLTFDADYSNFSQKALSSPQNLAISSGIQKKTSNKDILYTIHCQVLKQFKKIENMEYDRENYDQFAVYFEFLCTIPGGEELIMSYIGGYVPSTSGPAGTIPSGLHARTIASMMNHLNPDQFTVQHEFNGLKGGIFPIDAAVYFQGRLLAFIEVDGEFHYKLSGQQLRRKDRLKEFLYRHHFPSTPLYRVRHDQCYDLGFDKIGKGLAMWISALARKRLAATSITTTATTTSPSPSTTISPPPILDSDSSTSTSSSSEKVVVKRRTKKSMTEGGIEQTGGSATVNREE